MSIRLSYVLGVTRMEIKGFNVESDGWLEWLYYMIEKNPTMNFFFTEETTDIWRDSEFVVTHSCSCHDRTEGPCRLCKSLGCEVWDFNQVAGLVEETENPYYEDWLDASDSVFEPKTPCMYIDTRPCETIEHPGNATTVKYRYPKQQCQTKCARFDKVIVRG